MRTIAAILAATLLSSCGGKGGEDSAGQSRQVPVGAEYVLGYGKSLSVQGGLTLEFTSLAEESRCPLNVECFWQGNARILVTGKTARGSTVIELNTTEPGPTSGQIDGLFVVSLRNLEPYPGSNPQNGAVSIPVSSYEATLFVGAQGP